MYLAIKTRRVHTAFAESKWVGMCIYNMCLVFLLFGPIETWLILSEDYKYLLRSVGLFLVFGGVLFLIFGPKFLMICTGDEVNSKDFFKKMISSGSVTLTGDHDKRGSTLSSASTFSSAKHRAKTPSADRGSATLNWASFSSRVKSYFAHHNDDPQQRSGEPSVVVELTNVHQPPVPPTLSRCRDQDGALCS